MAKAWIKLKELERNHVGHEMLLLAMLMDRMVGSNPEFLKSEACEIVARRIYALQKAFHNVQSAADWRQPKGAQASKWKSKVRWDLASEIDWRCLSQDNEILPEVEVELQQRLSHRANTARAMAATASPTAGEEDA